MPFCKRTSGLPSIEHNHNQKLVLIPPISKLINQLWDTKYFTKLNVQWGFNNVRIWEGDKWKAAFQTNQGSFETQIMFFSLTNSPLTFQTMMNDVFQDLIMKDIVCVYLDDILIFTKALSEHQRVVQLVIERLQEYKLFLKLENCC